MEEDCVHDMPASSEPLRRVRDSSANTHALEFLEHFKGSHGKDSI